MNLVYVYMKEDELQIGTLNLVYAYMKEDELQKEDKNIEFGVCLHEGR